MNFTQLIELIAGCSVIPAILFLINVILYREPGKVLPGPPGQVSVLIPARDEERSIAAAVHSVLGSRGIEIEVVVLDDGSSDHTAAIVEEISAADGRVRLESAPPLPAGWNGKQHACARLAALARYHTFCFLDADVRLQPDALPRMLAYLERTKSDLVSGFPRQETGTFLEWLLLPLIHFVLLAYLPIAGMRFFSTPGFAAGCGQFFMVRRHAYEQSGGHGQIRTTMHDGILLPQLLRKHGFRTDIADLTKLASCRMYHNGRQVWSGLAKNATEGMAAPSRILIFSGLLFFGQIMPIVLGAFTLLKWTSLPAGMGKWIVAAIAGAFLPRVIAAIRYRQYMVSALLHPVGVATLLTLQWYSLIRKLSGRPATWKERLYNPG